MSLYPLRIPLFRDFPQAQNCCPCGVCFTIYSWVHVSRPPFEGRPPQTWSLRTFQVSFDLGSILAPITWIWKLQGFHLFYPWLSCMSLDLFLALCPYTYYFNTFTSFVSLAWYTLNNVPSLFKWPYHFPIIYFMSGVLPSSFFCRFLQPIIISQFNLHCWHLLSSLCLRTAPSLYISLFPFTSCPTLLSVSGDWLSPDRPSQSFPHAVCLLLPTSTLPAYYGSPGLSDHARRT